MKKGLQILALLIGLGAAAVWAAAGANRGWTKDSVAVKSLDPVTGIEGISYQKKFSPGVDFLGAAFGLSAILAGGSLFFKKQKSPNDKGTNSSL